MAAEKKYPPLSFRVCRGILSLEKKFGPERLVAACACASVGRQYGYNEIRGILERGDDINFMPSSEEETLSQSPKASARHKNIRGREYFNTQSSLSMHNEYGNE